jgi:nucleoside recognition membrane protein YjiH
MDPNTIPKERITIKAWIALAILIILFSGIFQKAEGPIRAVDFNNLTGKFGEVAEGINFQGKGGVGAKEGFIFALTLIPSVMLAVGLINVVEEMGALRAARKIFNPLLRPLLGIPGTCGIAFVSSFTSSDVASFMTKQLYEEGNITDDERSIFVAYQYAGSAVILNTIYTQAPLLPFSLLAVGPIIVILFVCKLFGANLLRLYLRLTKKKKAVGEI